MEYNKPEIKELEAELPGGISARDVMQPAPSELSAANDISADVRIANEARDALYQDVQKELDGDKYGSSTTDSTAYVERTLAALSAVLPPNLMASIAFQLQNASGIERKEKEEAELENQNQRINKKEAKDEEEEDNDNKRQNAYQTYTPAQWGAMESTSFKGMTNDEAIAALKMINRDQKKYLDWAISQGLIKEEERDDFKEYMIRRQEIEEERKANGGHISYESQEYLDKNVKFEKPAQAVAKEAQRYLAPENAKVSTSVTETTNSYSTAISPKNDFNQSASSHSQQPLQIASNTPLPKPESARMLANTGMDI